MLSASNTITCKEPNYNPVFDIAIKDIAVGEEIVFDYGEYDTTR